MSSGNNHYASLQYESRWTVYVMHVVDYVSELTIKIKKNAPELFFFYKYVLD